MITITMTSYNMGDDATESDFDSWVNFVSDKLGGLINYEVNVESDNFGTAGDDRIDGADDGQREELRELLGVSLWNEWCEANDAEASA